VKKDVMIDFETFGNGKNACICQVGACYFDRKTGEIYQMFSANIDARSAVDSGAEMDADTVYWWLSQDKAAIESITKQPQKPIREVFNELNEFLKDADCIWSHATFDFVIMNETFKRLKIKPLYSYRSARDIRTLLDLSGVDYKAFTREGIHHEGLADAMHQVKYCQAAFTVLEG